MIKTIVTGVKGRMGKRIAECVLEDDQLEYGGGVERADHLERDTVLFGKPVVANLEDIIDHGTVIIDFTAPEATLTFAEQAARHGKALVCGTTGFSPSQMQALEAFGSQIPLVYSPNMSLGVNLLFQLVEQVAGTLSESYDIEITEAHHRFKKDAPSGTAKRLANLAASARNLDPKTAFDHGREGMTGERSTSKIGVHAVRGGDIVGEHTVSFIGLGERVELTHRAHSRDTFVRGALQAARWVIEQKPGFYSMSDILNA